MAGLTPEEQAELAALEAELGSAQKRGAPASGGGGLSKDEEAELAALEAELAPQKGVGRKALDFGLQALDYAGGVTRAAIAAPTSMGTVDDLKAAVNPFDGKLAPSTSEYLERGGMGEGGKLSDVLGGMYAEPGQGEIWQMEKGGMLDPTARGAAGFVGDVVLDPAVWLTMGGALAAKSAAKAGTTATTKRMALEGAKANADSALLKGGLLEKLEKEALDAGTKATSRQKLAGTLRKAEDYTNPMAWGMRAGGKKLYQSAFGEADRLAEKMGKVDAPSQHMWDSGFVGTADGAEKHAQKLTDDLLAHRDMILKNADTTAARANVDDALAPLRDYIARSSGNWTETEIAQANKFLRKAEKDYARHRTTEGVEQTLKLGDTQSVPMGLQLPDAPPPADVAQLGMAYEVPAGTRGIVPDQALPNHQAVATQLPLAGETPLFGANLGGDVPLPGVDPAQLPLAGIGKEVPVGTVAPQVQLGFDLPTPQGKQAVQMGDAVSMPTNIPDPMQLALQERLTQLKVLAAENPELLGQRATMGEALQLPLEGTFTAGGNKGATASQASAFKTSANNALPDSYWDKLAKTPQGKEMQRMLGKGWKEETEAVVKRGLGADSADAVKALNSKAGDLLTVRKAFGKEAAKEGRKNAISQIDAILLGLNAPAALATKQAIKWTNSTLGKTVAGKAAHKSSRVVDPLLKRWMIDEGR